MDQSMTIDQLIDYRSQEHNFYSAGLDKKTICVLRQCQGTYMALAIPQNQYKEWLGCFSLLTNKKG
jgi:hypothetical protein